MISFSCALLVAQVLFLYAIAFGSLELLAIRLHAIMCIYDNPSFKGTRAYILSQDLHAPCAKVVHRLQAEAAFLWVTRVDSYNQVAPTFQLCFPIRTKARNYTDTFAETGTVPVRQLRFTCACVQHDWEA